jgi:hypothetical protein
VVTTVKEPRFLHKEKIELTKKLCDKFYYYWKNTRSNLILLEDRNKLYEAQIKSLKESNI